MNGFSGQAVKLFELFNVYFIILNHILSCFSKSRNVIATINLNFLKARKSEMIFFFNMLLKFSLDSLNILFLFFLNFFQLNLILLYLLFQGLNFPRINHFFGFHQCSSIDCLWLNWGVTICLWNRFFLSLIFIVRISLSTTKWSHWKFILINHSE